MKQLFSISTGIEVVQPILAMRIGEQHFSYAITNADASRLGSLAYYSTGSSNADTLNAIFSAHPELNNSFFQILICYDYAKSIMIPSEHYSLDNAGPLLNNITGSTINSFVISEAVAGWQMNNVYAVPVEVHEWVTRKFPSGKTGHNYSLAVRNLKSCDTTGCISLDILTSDLSIVAGKENKLLLAQNFSWSSPEDVIYYLLKVCQQLDLSQREVKVALSGLIEKESFLFKELQQYFMHIELKEATWIADNNEYPAHFFTLLNDLAKCAS